MHKKKKETVVPIDRPDRERRFEVGSESYVEG